MVSVIIKLSTRKTKKFMAVFSDGRIIHFGQKGSSVFYDHKDENKKMNYIKRHRVNEDWSKIGPASLSRYILWNKKSLSESIKDFKKRFKLD